MLDFNASNYAFFATHTVLFILLLEQAADNCVLVNDEFDFGPVLLIIPSFNCTYPTK